MKKNFTKALMLTMATFGLCLDGLAQFSDLLISEYAEGSSNNKYIELYNGTGDSIDLSGYELWRISNGGSWPEYTVSLSGWLYDGDILVAANSNADASITGLSNATTVYNSATFFNGDDAVGLAKDDGAGNFILIDAVGMQGADPGTGWDVAGYSNATANRTLVRKPCVTSPDTNWAVSAGTDSISSQWYVYPQNTWTYAGSHDTVCAVVPTPPTGSTPYYMIGDINNVDADGVADSLSVNCWIQGVVLGVDMNGGSALQFTLYDQEGIGVYWSGPTSTYTVQEGDSVKLRGTIGQFNGLTQMNPDSLILVNTGNAIPSPTVVTALDETTESKLVRIESISITNVSGSNYTLSDGTNTFIMRVDSDTDVNDSLSFNVGDSLCYVIGIGGQYDNSNPYTSGYQIFPRYYTDVDTSCGASVTPPTPTATPYYSIADINNVDADGVADSVNVECWTQGVVLGVDMNGGSALQFTIYDQEGLGVYWSGPTSTYVVQEGDSVKLRGTISQFNGLTQMNPDSLVLVNSGNAIPSPTVVTALDETTESKLVRIESISITNVSGSNYTLSDGTNTFIMRVDSDTDVNDSLSFTTGDSLCYVVGIGGQYDNSNPYTSGYQIFPRYYTDVDTSCGTPVTPPAPTAVPYYSIADINNVDADGVADSLNVECWTQGVVLGVDLQGNANLQFTIYDQEGIGIFWGNPTSSYVVNEGDSVKIRGKVSQFNGLTQMNPDSLILVNTGNTIPTPQLVNNLGENTESKLIRIEDFVVVDPGSGSGSFNMTLAKGNDTLAVRVDSDTEVDDLITFSAGQKLCSVTGIGGQYDNSNPYTSGYQLLPRRATDVDTNSANCGGTAPAAVPYYPIADINNVDADGVADSIDVVCWTQGVVLGVDLQGNANLQFTIYDQEGIGIFWGNPTSSYAVQEGDSVKIRGKVSQFNGLTQMNPDSLVVVSTGNTIPTPEMVSTLGENTESKLVKVEGFTIIDPGSGSGSFNMTLAKENDTILVRIDSDTDVDDVLTFSANQELCSVTGIGGQYDNSSPYTSGYQLLPRRATDVDTNTVNCKPNSIETVAKTNDFLVYPNPVSGETLRFNQTADYSIFNVSGQLMIRGKAANRVNVGRLTKGIYVIRTEKGEAIRFIKE